MEQLYIGEFLERIVRKEKESSFHNGYSRYFLTRKVHEVTSADQVGVYSVIHFIGAAASAESSVVWFRADALCTVKAENSRVILICK